jgi:hypothetical protein
LLRRKTDTPEGQIMRLTSLALAAVAGAALTLVLVIGAGRLGGGWYEAKTHTESNVIIEQIKLVAKLQTVEYHGANTVKLDKTDWKGKTTAVFLLEGTVTASVDLEQMSLSVSGRGADRVVDIELPEVVVAKPVVKRFEILMSCESFLTAPELSDEERNQIHAEALIGLMTMANRNGIRDKARQQAQDYLATFVRALGYRAQFS